MAQFAAHTFFLNVVDQNYILLQHAVATESAICGAAWCIPLNFFGWFVILKLQQAEYQTVTKHPQQPCMNAGYILFHLLTSCEMQLHTITFQMLQVHGRGSHT